MYMIPVAEYESLRRGGNEGIVGNVSDSNVHNIEVTQGGSIEINDGCQGKKESTHVSAVRPVTHDNSRKKSSTAGKTHVSRSRGKRKGGVEPWDDNEQPPPPPYHKSDTKRGAILHQQQDDTRGDDDDKGGGDEKVNGKQLAAASKKLASAGMAPNAISSAVQETRQYLPPPAPMEVDEPLDEDVEMLSNPQKRKKLSQIVPNVGPPIQSRIQPQSMPIVRKGRRQILSKPKIVPPSPQQEQDKAMSDLVKHRLDELRGIKTFPPQPKLPPPDLPIASPFRSRWGKRGSSMMQRQQREQRKGGSSA